MTISTYTLAVGATVEELNAAVAAHIAAGRQPWSAPIVAQARAQDRIGLCQPIVSGTSITSCELVTGKTVAELVAAVTAAIAEGKQPYGALLVHHNRSTGHSEFCQPMIVGTPEGGGGGTSGGVQHVDVTLTIAQLRTLSSSPLELVPAPGANKLAMPREFYYRFFPSAPPVAFDFSNSFQYAIGALGNPQDYFGNMQSNGLQPAFGMMSAPDWSLGYADLLNAANQPIRLTATPIGGGDGSGWVRCYYEVIDLP